MIIRNITEIKPNPNNPRIIKDEKFFKLVQSIKDFPDMLNKRPLVCVTDKDGLIFPLGGNMRLRAAKELDMKTLPVEMADNWTEEQRREFVIKDNVSFGEWDWDILANEWDTEQLEEWGLDTITKQNWDELDYIDENLPAPEERKDNIITIVVPDELLSDIQEIEKLIKNTISKDYSGCEIK